jgi:hypothetical protein
LGSGLSEKRSCWLPCREASDTEASDTMGGSRLESWVDGDGMLDSSSVEWTFQLLYLEKLLGGSGPTVP